MKTVYLFALLVGSAICMPAKDGEEDKQGGALGEFNGSGDGESVDKEGSKATSAQQEPADANKNAGESSNTSADKKETETVGSESNPEVNKDDSSNTTSKSADTANSSGDGGASDDVKPSDDKSNANADKKEGAGGTTSGQLGPDDASPAASSDDALVTGEKADNNDKVDDAPKQEQTSTVAEKSVDGGESKKESEAKA